MVHLELDDLLAIASEVLRLEVDDLVRATDLGLADPAVARPQARFGGKDLYPSPEAKAAALLYGVAKNHPFIDGNKRVAVLATLQLLNTNGLDLDLSPPEEAYKVIAGVAASTVSLEDLTSWIGARLERSSDR